MPRPIGKCGRKPACRDASIQPSLTMKVLFGVVFGQAIGFVESLLGLIGLGCEVPTFSTLSRRH